jgi:hypothetical protein
MHFPIAHIVATFLLKLFDHFWQMVEMNMLHPLGLFAMTYFPFDQVLLPNSPSLSCG